MAHAVANHRPPLRARRKAINTPTLERISAEAFAEVGRGEYNLDMSILQGGSNFGGDSTETPSLARKDVDEVMAAGDGGGGMRKRGLSEV